MVSFYNELPLTSLTYTPNSARIAVTYLSQVIGVRGTERSFFVNSIPQPRVDTLEAYLSENHLPQFPLVSINKSRLVAPLDVTYKDSRYDYIYTQLMGATHNYHTLQRAFKRRTISSFFLNKPFPLRARKTSLMLYSSFASRMKRKRRGGYSIKFSFPFKIRFKRRSLSKRTYRYRVSRRLRPVMIPKCFSSKRSLILSNPRVYTRVSYLQGPLLRYKVQKSTINPLLKPPYLKSLVLNLFYDHPEDIYRSWKIYEHKLQYATIRLLKHISILYYPRVQSNIYTSLMAKLAFSFVRKAYWCYTGPFHLYQLSKHEVTPRLYRIFSNRVLGYKTITLPKRGFFGHITNLLHPDSKLFRTNRLNSLLRFEPYFASLLPKLAKRT